MDDFVPTKFIFVNFYNKEACIVWNAEKIVILDYPLPESLNDGVICISPSGKIKDIQCLKNKIYVLCNPAGIYKLSQNHTFARVSSSGIGIGISFYQVFNPKHNLLYCDNKYSKTTKSICNIQGDVQDIKFFHLFTDEMHNDLQKALIGNKNCDSCLITNQSNLLLFSNDETTINYTCNASIVDITAIHKNDKLFGIILLTDVSKIVAIYPKNSKLEIEQICLESRAKALSAGIYSSGENKIWIIYSDGENTYHLKKNLNQKEPAKTLSVTVKEFLCLTLYKSRKLCGLTRNESDSICFIQVPIEELEITEDSTEEEESDITTDLTQEMFKGSELIMDEIAETSVQLDKVNANLEKERNLLNRIKMYTSKRRVECVPKIKVHCLSDRKFIVVNFHKSLPQGTQIVMSVHQERGQIFVINRVTDTETVVELSLPNESISQSATFHVHSIIVDVQNGPWCFISDFVTDPVTKEDTKHPLDSEKLNFLNNKLLMLKKLITDKKIDMKILSDIKRSIRRELPDV